MTEMIINPPNGRDKAGWQGLFKSYARFYRVPLRPDSVERVWKWLTDPQHELEALLARTPDGQYLGFVHFRSMPHAVTGTTGCHMDDLFVAQSFRGTGVADALIYAVSAIGRRRGWRSVRWVVAEDNYRARAVFDRHGRRARGVQYEIDLTGLAPPRPTRVVDASLEREIQDYPGDAVPTPTMSSANRSITDAGSPIGPTLPPTVPRADPRLPPIDPALMAAGGGTIGGAAGIRPTPAIGYGSGGRPATAPPPVPRSTSPSDARSHPPVPEFLRGGGQRPADADGDDRS